MGILDEKEAFLKVYVIYKDDSRKITFNEETEQFMWRKNNISDTEVEYVHLMNQRWYAWLACAKSKAQAVPEGFVLMPIKPTETMVMAVVKEHEGDAFLPYSLYDAYVKQAIIEAQDPAND